MRWKSFPTSNALSGKFAFLSSPHPYTALKKCETRAQVLPRRSHPEQRPGQSRPGHYGSLTISAQGHPSWRQVRPGASGWPAGGMNASPHRRHLSTRRAVRLRRLLRLRLRCPGEDEAVHEEGLSCARGPGYARLHLPTTRSSAHEPRRTSPSGFGTPSGGRRRRPLAPFCAAPVPGRRRVRPRLPRPPPPPGPRRPRRAGRREDCSRPMLRSRTPRGSPTAKSRSGSGTPRGAARLPRTAPRAILSRPTSAASSSPPRGTARC
jgi:hypothetical protein